jgi:hypothetical protein
LQNRETFADVSGGNRAVAKKQTGARWSIDYELRQSLDLHAELRRSHRNFADLVNG